MSSRATEFRTSQTCSPVFILDNLGNVDSIEFLGRVHQYHSKPGCGFGLENGLRLEKIAQEVSKMLQVSKPLSNQQPSIQVARRQRAQLPNSPSVKSRKIQKLKLYIAKKNKAVDLFERGEHDLKKIASATKLAVHVVKRVIGAKELLNLDPPHPELDVEVQKFNRIDEEIRSVQAPFFTIQSIKRSLNLEGICAGRSLISRRLKQHRLRWSEVKIQKRLNNIYTINKENLAKAKILVRMMYTSVCVKDSLYFSDEIKLVVRQHPKKAWQSAVQDLQRARPASEVTLTCIATSNFGKFVSLQFFCKELTADDYNYHWSILDNELKRRNRQYRVLIDSAPWHNNDAVNSGPMKNRIVFNIKQFYSANLIESQFSFVRSRWRQRPLAVTIEDEVKTAIQIFQEFNSSSFEESYRRRYLKTILELVSRIQTLEGMAGES